MMRPVAQDISRDQPFSWEFHTTTKKSGRGAVNVNVWLDSMKHSRPGSELNNCSTKSQSSPTKGAKEIPMKKNRIKSLVSTITAMAVGLAIAVGFASIAAQPVFAAAGDSISFSLVPSEGVKSCLAYALPYGHVTISDLGPVQNMHVEVFHLPGKAEFALFVIQVPNKPFGLAWYQGDIETDSAGRGVADVTGIFSAGTFTLAPGVAPAPKLFPDDATSNPATPPVQINHLGIWFGDPAVAEAAGCSGTVTPFESNHHAGIQVLNTSNYPETKGPLQGLH